MLIMMNVATQPKVGTNTKILKSSFERFRPIGTTLYTCKASRVTHHAWRVNYETLTQDEKEWLEAQEKYRRHKGICKPVKWAELSLAMFHESERRKTPDKFRPLFRETLGAAWNYKLWRFPGQEDEFPVFTETSNWSAWIETTAGKIWQAEKRG